MSNSFNQTYKDLAIPYFNEVFLIVDDVLSLQRGFWVARLLKFYHNQNGWKIKSLMFFEKIQKILRILPLVKNGLCKMIGQ